MNSSGPQKSWLAHPVPVSMIAIAATAAMAIGLYKEVLLPARLAACQFRIEELQRQLGDISRQKALLDETAASARQAQSAAKAQWTEELAQLRAKLSESQESARKIKAELDERILGNLFISDSPYPIGLDKLHLGEKIAALESAYPDARAQTGDGWTTIKVVHPYFSDITFYHDDHDGNEIYQISFSVKYDNRTSPAHLQEQLERAFGKPTEIAPDSHTWSAPRSTVIYKDSNYRFLVSQTGVVPTSWVQKMRRHAENKEGKRSKLSQ